jgi:putative transcriptional regulator
VFEWDEAKSTENLEKRGFDFEFAARIFKGSDLLEYEDRRRLYGEHRFVAIGEVESEILFVVTLGAVPGAGSFQRAVPDGGNGMPIVKRSVRQIGKGRVNWERLRATTDREIARQIVSDPDVPEMNAADLRRARRIYNPPVPNVKAIRHKLGLSQAEFAQQFGFSVRTVQQWEQRRAVPDRPARILLRVIETAPQAVERALAVNAAEGR